MSLIMDLSGEMRGTTRPAVDMYAYRSVILFYIAYHNKDPEPNFNSAVNYLLKKALEFQEEIEKMKSESNTGDNMKLGSLFGDD